MGVEPEEMLEENGIPSQRRVEDPDVKAAFQGKQDNRDGQDRCCQHLDKGRGVVRPDEKRQPEPGQSGSAHLVNRYDEIESRQNGGEACDENSEAGGYDVAVRVSTAVRRVEGPPGIHASDDYRGETDDSTKNVNVPTQQIDAREGEVFGAHH